VVFLGDPVGRWATTSAKAGAGRAASVYRQTVFDVAADAYGRFMGRYSEPLSERFADWAGVCPGERALDVGSGPGAVAARLVDRLGLAAVSAVDPSQSFLASLRARLPGLDVQSGTAEQLPFPDDLFDHALAQLVVHFMKDPVSGLTEMARVTRPGGSVSACVWDFAGGRAPLSVFWHAVTDLDPGVRTEDDLAGAREGDLVRLLEAAELSGIRSGELVVRVEHQSFEDWWEPYTYGVGPAGEYVASLEPGARDALRERCRDLLPSAPWDVDAVAWAARGTV
jgi:SAM-dependent methyltransferase